MKKHFENVENHGTKRKTYYYVSYQLNRNFVRFLSNFRIKTEIFVEILNQNFIIFSVIFTRKSRHHNVLSATCSDLVVIPLKMKFCSKIEFFEKNFRYAILIPHFILSRTIICVGGNFSFLIKNF